MEIAEKGENQTIISPKWMKFQEIDEGGEEDRISRLPDCLLLEILSRLPSTMDAIHTGPLSKRWERLWTLVPTLIFPDCDHSLGWLQFIYETLVQCRQLKLKRFQMHMNGYDIRLNSDINSWIGDAIKRNVEDLHITLCDFDPEEECQLVDEVFFTSSSLTDLTLRGCNLNPRGTITWINLRSLSISRANLDEKLIKNILPGSPALETLVLDDCYGFRRLDINSRSVKKLVLSGYIEPSENYGGNMIEINAPNISSLTIEDILELFKVLLVNMSSLVKANLNYRINGLWEITHDTTEEEMLKGHIVSLRHVKEVNIGSTALRLCLV